MNVFQTSQDDVFNLLFLRVVNMWLEFGYVSGHSHKTVLDENMGTKLVCVGVCVVD